MAQTIETADTSKIMKQIRPLPISFYARDTLTVTKEILEKYLVRQTIDHTWIARIVEVEAYIGHDDPASHAYRGLTPRTKIMFGPPGHAYVYFTYGMYFMLNVVTERDGFPAAILIRALEPVSGFPEDDPRPANGPGKLCRTLQIDKKLNGEPLTGNRLWIGEIRTEKKHKPQIRWSSRIGINVGQDKVWRAYIYGSPHLSRKSKEDDSLIPVPQ
jgi:DNA-3-methyladenine glycosylase